MYLFMLPLYSTFLPTQSAPLRAPPRGLEEELFSFAMFTVDVFVLSSCSTFPSLYLFCVSFSAGFVNDFCSVFLRMEMFWAIAVADVKKHSQSLFPGHSLMC